MNSPPDVIGKLKRNLVNKPRPNAFAGYQRLVEEHERLKRTVAQLAARVKALEGGGNSPPDTPPTNL